jgi:hypothetical protein
VLKPPSGESQKESVNDGSRCNRKDCRAISCRVTQTWTWLNADLLSGMVEGKNCVDHKEEGRNNRQQVESEAKSL